MIMLMSFMAEQERLRNFCEKLPVGKVESLKTLEQQNETMMRMVQDMEERREQKLREKMKKLEQRIKEIEYYGGTGRGFLSTKKVFPRKFKEATPTKFPWNG